MRSRLICALAVAITGAAIALAGPASAHVTVSAPGATRGGSDTIITFRVPTESATASTTGLKVQFPTDTPIASVLVQPQPGWTFTSKTAKLATPIKTDDGDVTEAVSEIDWSASNPAQGIKPGEFGEFIVIAGQLPDAPSITFKAIQTYSDGSAVDWIEVPAPGSSAEPEHPAPVLQLAAAASASSNAASSPSVTVSAAAAVSAKSSSQTGPVVLSVIALVVAAAAAVLGGLAFGRGRGRRT